VHGTVAECPDVSRDNFVGKSYITSCTLFMLFEVSCSLRHNPRSGAQGVVMSAVLPTVKLLHLSEPKALSEYNNGCCGKFYLCGPHLCHSQNFKDWHCYVDDSWTVLKVFSSP
jgi:hypothetical protein